MKPDAIDTKILEVLMSDGRASFRQIAQRTSLTTPTVSSRLARMMKAGLIKKFVPVLSPDSVDRGVMALVTLRVRYTSAQKIADDLAELREVEAVYMTTGQGITIKLTLDSAQELQSFLARNLLRRRGADVTSSQVITSIVKEEPTSLLPDSLVMSLKCDYCGGDVTSSRPYTVAAGSSHYYFCCKTCRKDYLAEHGNRLVKISRKLNL
ncbi:MAG: winged helix-turn-helix transcriptional regulator [Nitrososphaerota archaeon]|nr:winged helix-turn-helix transcriptional regulator [Nitrososphaerota archaeon]